MYHFLGPSCPGDGPEADDLRSAPLPWDHGPMRMLLFLLSTLLCLSLPGCDGDTTLVVASGTRPSGEGSGGGGLVVVASNASSSLRESVPPPARQARAAPENSFIEPQAPVLPQGTFVPVPALGSTGRSLMLLCLAGFAGAGLGRRKSD